MAKKKSSNPAFRQLGGDIPDELVQKLDVVVNELGLLKKRALAASVAAFLSVGAEVQTKMYQEVCKKYYGSMARGTPKDMAKDVGKTLGKAKRTRKSTKSA